MSTTTAEPADTDWRPLHRLGAGASLALLVYSLVTMAHLLIVGGPPETASEAFKLLQERRLVGLLRLDTLTLLAVPLYFPLLLSLGLALRAIQRPYVTLATLLGMAGVTLFLATPSVFSLVALSDRHAAAMDVVERERLLAAGEAILASDMWHATGAATGGFLLLVAGLWLSVVMLRSPDFLRATAWAGLLTHALDMAHVLGGLFSETLGFVLMAVAGPLYLVWFPLLARDLWRLGQGHATDPEP